MGITSSLQSIGRVTDPMRSYWSVTLTTGKTLSEQGVRVDLRAGGVRPIDWSLDLVSTGDILKITQVVLHCPDGRYAWLDIEEPGTVFQLKIATMSVLTGRNEVQSHLIGKVTDKLTGACDCWVWDREMGLFLFTSSIYAFGSWRPGVLALGHLSLDVLGLRM